jgi:hypothetical protein
MAGLVPAIHGFLDLKKTWMPGTRPGMTMTSVKMARNKAPILEFDSPVEACPREVRTLDCQGPAGMSVEPA